MVKKWRWHFNRRGEVKSEKDALVKEEKEYFSELTHLKQLYIDSDLMTQEEYARLVEDLEMQHLNRQLDIAGMEPDEIEKSIKRF